MKRLKINENEKLGLVADVHGNGTFLVGALNELIASGVNKFLILGDIFTEFQENHKILNALKMLEQRYDVTYIKGNREVDFVEKRKGNREQLSYENTGLSIIYSYDQLSDADLDWIEGFHDDCIVEFPNGQKALATHFAKLNDNQKEIVAQENISMIISGHTHRVYNQEVDGMWYINPGAVGLNEDSISYGGTYGILDVTKDRVEFTAHVYHANQKEINDVYESLKTEGLAESFLGMALDLSMKTGRNMNTVFFKEVQRLSGLYRETKEERLQSGFYQPQDLKDSLTSGYLDADINGKPLPYDKHFVSLGGNTNFRRENISSNNKFTSNMELLNDPIAKKEIFRVALNNVIYYGTLIEQQAMGKSVVADASEIEYGQERR